VPASSSTKIKKKSDIESSLLEAIEEHGEETVDATGEKSEEKQQ